MKVIHYINPTDRMSAAMQRRLALPFKPTQEIIEGADGLGLEDALMQLRPGRGLLVAEFALLHRRTKERAAIAARVFASSAHLLDAYGRDISPADGPAFIEGMISTKRYLASKTARKMADGQVHNRVSDGERERVLKYWLDHDLTVAQLEKFSGYSYSALRNWFAEQCPRPDRRGRRPKQKRKT